MNVSGELQRSLPLAARRHWSEFLRLVPGTVSTDTTADQASIFFVHGAGAVSGSTLVDGADISSAVNPWTGYIAFPADSVADVQIRTSGLDASAPLGMGAAANIAMRSGTNKDRGSAIWACTPATWVSNNTPGAATSQTITINQPEGAVGGPLMRNRLWFYGSYRRRVGTLGLSRSAEQIANMKALVPGFDPFDNGISANVLFGKISGQISPTQHLSGFYNYDATSNDKDMALNAGRFTNVITGGHAMSTRLTSILVGLAHEPVCVLLERQGIQYDLLFAARRRYRRVRCTAASHRTGRDSVSSLRSTTRRARRNRRTRSGPSPATQRLHPRVEQERTRSSWASSCSRACTAQTRLLTRTTASRSRSPSFGIPPTRPPGLFRSIGESTHKPAVCSRRGGSRTTPSSSRMHGAPRHA